MPTVRPYSLQAGGGIATVYGSFAIWKQKRAISTDRPLQQKLKHNANITFFVMGRNGKQKKQREQHRPESKIMISVRLTPYLKHEAERIARERGCTLSMAIRALLFYAVESIAAANSGEEPPPG